MDGATPLLRQWQIIIQLSARRSGATVKELAEEFGVVQRTIRRDLQALQRAGFPLDERTSSHGRKHWRLHADASRPPLRFTWDEAVALFLARRHLEPLAGTPLWESAQRAFRKIRATLSESAMRYLDKISGAFHHTRTGTGDYARKGEIIDGLMIAIEDRRIAFITYQSARATEPVTYEVYPFGIVFHRQSLYLVAYSVSHDEVRHFKIDRLSDVQLETLQFTRPADFDLQQHLADSFGIFHGEDGQSEDVKIRFSPEVARYVAESRWHHSQKLSPQQDGSLIFQVTLGTTEEIKSWVLSFGAQAEVLKPRHLREEISEEIHRMEQQYKPARTKDKQT